MDVASAHTAAHAVTATFDFHPPFGGYDYDYDDNVAGAGSHSCRSSTAVLLAQILNIDDDAVQVPAALASGSAHTGTAAAVDTEDGGRGADDDHDHDDDVPIGGAAVPDELDQQLEALLLDAQQEENDDEQEEDGVVDGADLAQMIVPHDEVAQEAVPAGNVPVSRKRARTARTAQALSETQLKALRWALKHSISTAAQDEITEFSRLTDGSNATLRTLWKRVDSWREVDQTFMISEVQLDEGTTAHVPHRRNLWRVIKKRWLDNDDIFPHLKFQHVPDLEFYNEAYSSSRFAEVLNKAQKKERTRGKRILQLILFSDGSEDPKGSLRPLYIMPANLPLGIMQHQDAKLLVGYMPKPSKAAAGPMDNAGRRLLHKALVVALTDIATKSMDVAGGHSYACDLFAYICDHVEKSDVTLCRKVHTTALPCHICTIKKEEFGDARKGLTQPHARRKFSDTRATLAAAADLVSQDRKEDAATLLKANSLIAVENELAILWDFDPHATTPPDALHDLDLGIFKTFFDDIWSLLNKKDRYILNARISACTRGEFGHPTLKGFGPFDLFPGGARMDGSRYRTLMRILPLVVRDLKSLKKARLQDEIVELANTWVPYYVRATTAATPRRDRSAIALQGLQWFEKYRSTLGHLHGDGGAGGDTIKAHDWFVESVWALDRFGSSVVCSTSAFEALHKFYVHDLLRRTNGRDVMLQLLKRIERFEVVHSLTGQFQTPAAARRRAPFTNRTGPFIASLGSIKSVRAVLDSLAQIKPQLPAEVRAAISMGDDDSDVWSVREGTALHITQATILHCAEWFYSRERHDFVEILRAPRNWIGKLRRLLVFQSNIIEHHVAIVEYVRDVHTDGRDSMRIMEDEGNYGVVQMDSIVGQPHVMPKFLQHGGSVPKKYVVNPFV